MTFFIGLFNCSTAIAQYLNSPLVYSYSVQPSLLLGAWRISITECREIDKYIDYSFKTLLVFRLQVIVAVVLIVLVFTWSFVIAGIKVMVFFRNYLSITGKVAQVNVVDDGFFLVSSLQGTLLHWCFTYYILLQLIFFIYYFFESILYPSSVFTLSKKLTSFFKNLHFAGLIFIHLFVKHRRTTLRWWRCDLRSSKNTMT